MLAHARTHAWRVGSTYAGVSTSHPHTIAGLSAAGVVCSADLTCQLAFQRSADGSIDWPRTIGLTVFAAWHYGGPAKFLYLTYDRLLGTAPHMQVAVKKMLCDVYVHTPFLLIPSFYAITGAFKGQSLTGSVAQLKAEWFEASFGSALFWTPICAFNFRYIPQHSRILTVSVASFVHKTWLSYLSNRQRHKERM